MLPNKIDVRKLIVKYMFAISILSFSITLFTRNIGLMILSIVIFIFSGSYLLVSNKEKKFFDEVQNMF
jgi:hypothetical protein